METQTPKFIWVNFAFALNFGFQALTEIFVWLYGDYFLAFGFIILVLKRYVHRLRVKEPMLESAEN